MEQYSLVQQYSEKGPSDEEYTRFNHNVYDVLSTSHSHTSTPIPPMYSTLPTNGNMTNYISSPDNQYSTLYKIISTQIYQYTSISSLLPVYHVPI